MTQLVIGMGEVGHAVYDVLTPYYDVKCKDIDDDTIEDEIDVIHICFPYSSGFVTEVQRYERQFSNPGVIVHSTVPPGTCGPSGWVHSPVHGRHPNLARDMKTFTKFFGGKHADDAAKIFADVGVTTAVTDKAVTTELGKLWELVQYGMAISMEKMIHRDCDEFDADFDVSYTEMSRSYNRGYRALELGQYKRSIIEHMPGPIGGHCVVQNAVHLADHSTDPLAWMLAQIIDWAGHHDTVNNDNDTKKGTP